MKATLIYVGYVSSEPTFGQIPNSTPPRVFMNFDVVENVKLQGGETAFWRHVRVYGAQAERYRKEGLPKGSIVQVTGREVIRIVQNADGTPKLEIDLYSDELILVKRRDTVKANNSQGQEEPDLEYASA